MSDIVERLREGCPIQTMDGTVVGRTKPNPHEYEAAEEIERLRILKRTCECSEDDQCAIAKERDELRKLTEWQLIETAPKDGAVMQGYVEEFDLDGLLQRSQWYPNIRFKDGNWQVKHSHGWFKIPNRPTLAWYLQFHEDFVEAKDEAQRLRAALNTLVELNDNYGHFGGEIYQDKIDRAWAKARAAIAKAPSLVSVPEKAEKE